MQMYLNHYIWGFFTVLWNFLYFIIRIKSIRKFLTWKVGLTLETQAPKQANFYESQGIALKLKSMHTLHEKSMLYQPYILNQAESM